MFGWVRDGKFKRSDSFYLTYIVHGTNEQNIGNGVSVCSSYVLSTYPPSLMLSKSPVCTKRIKYFEGVHGSKETCDVSPKFPPIET